MGLTRATVNELQPHPKRVREERRAIVMDVLRSHTVKTIDDMIVILRDEYGIDASEDTVRRDFERVGAVRDTKSQRFLLHEGGLTRYDLYELLRHAVLHFGLSVTINKRKDLVVIHCEWGTARRVQGILEGIRQDESLYGRRKPWHDGIMAVVSNSDESVLAFFDDGTTGQKFYDKINAMANLEKDYEFVDNPDERDLLQRISKRE